MLRGRIDQSNAEDKRTSVADGLDVINTDDKKTRSTFGSTRYVFERIKKNSNN
jgi:hypothetical protein